MLAEAESLVLGAAIGSARSWSAASLSESYTVPFPEGCCAARRQLTRRTHIVEVCVPHSASLGLSDVVALILSRLAVGFTWANHSTQSAWHRSTPLRGVGGGRAG